MGITALHLKRNAMNTQPLKFGMDRILSEEYSPKYQQNSEVPPEENCMSALPCASCLTSLFRSCRSQPISPVHATNYNAVIHTPQPYRPYASGKSRVNEPRVVEEPNYAAFYDASMNKVDPVDPSISAQIHQATASSGMNPRRKRSWSRAVFSNLQRKGLEKRFQLQKYITKPDRRQLAATLGLSDAQVKVWFQNRRMKWRHTKEALQQNFGHNDCRKNDRPHSGQNHHSDSDCESEIDVQTIEN